MAQEGPKMAQEGPKMAQDGPKMAERRPRMAPRRRQEGPRWAKTTQVGPKMGQRGGAWGPKVVLSSRRNAHFQEKWCSRRVETLVFVFWGALGFKNGALVEAKRSFSDFGLFFSSVGAQDGPRWPQVD